ncbi:MAG: two-component sensor histidine kinase [Acetobacteraceae bacterium]|nr:two-component sensor histidine kinase [Acetobacteraceae bacterium]
MVEIARRSVRFGVAGVWPNSLAGRTALVLAASLTLVQAAGLAIYALDRMDLLTLAMQRDAAVRAISLYRVVSLSSPDGRRAALATAEQDGGVSARLQADPPVTELAYTAAAMQRQFRADMLLVPLPQEQRPREIAILGGPQSQRFVIGFRMEDRLWLNMDIDLPTPRPWQSNNFLAAFLLMAVVATVLSVWAVRRRIAPIGTLAAAAEVLGRDVNAPPLSQEGPTEIAAAAMAFNTMALRIRRFVQDRTFMLTAIGHDLRTPITRLKLRAEFVDDDDLRARMLNDLDELQAMVSATLAVGRDITADEPATRVDLVALLRTLLDELSDTFPDHAEHLTYTGPDSLPIHARPLALKRAIVNLVQNALNYGGLARVSLAPVRNGLVTLLVDDDGPGIADAKLEDVFQAFLRLEPSRNRETGGTGLGLTIARNILRAHGGDVKLENRPSGGLRVVVTLPV